MTVICWDGTSLAADKLATYGNISCTITKIFRIKGSLIGFAGSVAFGEQMLAWIEGGENPSDFPAGQRDKDDWAELLIIRPDKKIQAYSRTAYPITYEDTQFAIGSGGDLALAAMYCGKNAAEAVLVASALSAHCGNGVDTLEYDKCLG